MPLASFIETIEMKVDLNSTSAFVYKTHEFAFSYSSIWLCAFPMVRAAKKRDLNESDLCRSQHVYKRLRRFRAGIESGISWLKRTFGFGRCTWKGHRSFKSYVWATIVSANLLTIARKQQE